MEQTFKFWAVRNILIAKPGYTTTEKHHNKFEVVPVSFKEVVINFY